MTEHSVGSGRNNTGYAKKADSDQWSQQVLIPAANQNLQLYVQLSPLLKRPVWRRPLCKNLATFRNSKTNGTWRDSLTTFTSSFMKFCLILATPQKRPVMFYHGLVTSAQTYTSAVPIKRRGTPQSSFISTRNDYTKLVKKISQSAA